MGHGKVAPTVDAPEKHNAAVVIVIIKHLKATTAVLGVSNWGTELIMATGVRLAVVTAVFVFLKVLDKVAIGDTTAMDATTKAKHQRTRISCSIDKHSRICQTVATQATHSPRSNNH